VHVVGTERARGAGRRSSQRDSPAMPSFFGGLKQGWAFAWRSLLAGELIVLVPGKLTLGQQLDTPRQFADAAGLYGMMIVIFVIGVLVDTFVFGLVDLATT
jgi:NitT/TauT family transport system permease protein